MSFYEIKKYRNFFIITKDIGGLFKHVLTENNNFIKWINFNNLPKTTKLFITKEEAKNWIFNLKLNKFNF